MTGLGLNSKFRASSAAPFASRKTIIAKNHSTIAIMKKSTFLFTLLFLLCCHLSFGQNKISEEYKNRIKEADSLMKIGEFNLATANYTLAFKELKGKGHLRDKYSAVKAYSILDKPDTAFKYLNDLVNAGLFDYSYLLDDSDLFNLHKYPMWKTIIKITKQNYRLRYKQKKSKFDKNTRQYGDY